jgi:hydroxymethylpyrimidine/phosphomethylpyrimidine kinase
MPHQATANDRAGIIAPLFAASRRHHSGGIHFREHTTTMDTQPRIDRPRAMTISGSDSGAGSGIQADLKTFAALGVYGTSVVTAVTAQNTLEVAAIAEVPEEVVIAQIDTVFEDIGATVVKTGMLSGKTIIQNVADRLEAWGPQWLVVDPVLMSRGGVALLQRDAMGAFKRDLLPHVSLLTPGIAEAQILTGTTIASRDDLERAARTMHALGPRMILITGFEDEIGPCDMLFDGESFERSSRGPVPAPFDHGLSDTRSAAITAFLAHGLAPRAAIEHAERYIQAALRDAFVIGDGHSPANHATPASAGVLEAALATIPRQAHSLA